MFGKAKFACGKCLSMVAMFEPPERWQYLANILQMRKYCFILIDIIKNCTNLEELFSRFVLEASLASSSQGLIPLMAFLLINF